MPRPQRSADIIPFGPPKDYPEPTRFIRETHRPVDLYSSFEPEKEDEDDLIREFPWLLLGAVGALMWIGIFLIARWLAQ